MKKVFLLVLLLALFVFVDKVETMTNSYYNLINSNEIKYDYASDVFYSDQEISLNKDTNYTLVASSNFLVQYLKMIHLH